MAQKRLGRHPLLAYVLGGAVGGGIAGMYAVSVLDEDTGPGWPAIPFGQVAAFTFVILGGVLAGWFLVAIALSWAPGLLAIAKRAES